MKPIKTSTANRTYTGEGCENLPATVVQFSDGQFATETCFELEEAELEQLKETGKVYVTFMGQTIIPFMVRTISIAEPGVVKH